MAARHACTQSGTPNDMAGGRIRLEACERQQGKQQLEAQQQGGLPRQIAAQGMPAPAAACTHPPPGQALHKGDVAAGEEQDGEGVQAQGVIAQEDDSRVLRRSIKVPLHTL
jgi:hypothetical protein